MTQEHTPGPWHVVTLKGVANRVFAPIGGDSYMVADCTHYNAKLPIEMQEANARLIAAAPDLLEELEYCVYLIERGERSLPPDQKQNLTKQKAAIAKAKGV